MMAAMDVVDIVREIYGKNKYICGAPAPVHFAYRGIGTKYAERANSILGSRALGNTFVLVFVCNSLPPMGGGNVHSSLTDYRLSLLISSSVHRELKLLRNVNEKPKRSRLQKNLA